MSTLPNISILDVLIAFSIVLTVSKSFGHGADYPARYQPGFGNIKLETYLKNPRLFNLQLNCLLYDGPCDIVGRFLKPRIAKALLGECYLCTPNQEKEINKLLAFVQEKRPDLYRLAIRKYLQNQGFQVGPEEVTTVKVIQSNQQEQPKR